MPALMTIRLHIEQHMAFCTYSPVGTSLPTRYKVAPIMSRREAQMMALASAWTERHSSYRSPRGMPSWVRKQYPRSEQFCRPRGAPT